MDDTYLDNSLLAQKELVHIVKDLLEVCYLSVKFVPFDPWNSLPLLYIGDSQPKILKRIDEVAAVALATQGSLRLLRCLCVQVPISIVKQWLVRVYLSYQGSGLQGVFRLFNNHH